VVHICVQFVYAP